jgi:hypothetical protein
MIASAHREDDCLLIQMSLSRQAPHQLIKTLLSGSALLEALDQTSVLPRCCRYGGLLDLNMPIMYVGS